MNSMPYAAAEIEEEDALWESFCITCEPTGEGLLAADDSGTVSFNRLTATPIPEAPVSRN